jgi:hypothetical protein
VVRSPNFFGAPVSAIFRLIYTASLATDTFYDGKADAQHRCIRRLKNSKDLLGLSRTASRTNNI